MALKKHIFMLCIVMTVILSACAGWSPVDDLNTGNFQGAFQHVSPDFTLRSPDLFDRAKGISGYMAWIRAWRTMFPDLTVTYVTAENTDFYSWRIVGTHSRRYQAIEPTRNRIVIEGRALVRKNAGKLVTLWIFYDSAALAEQLGTTPAYFSRSNPNVDHLVGIKIDIFDDALVLSLLFVLVIVLASIMKYRSKRYVFYGLLGTLAINACATLRAYSTNGIPTASDTPVYIWSGSFGLAALIVIGVAIYVSMIK